VNPAHALVHFNLANLFEETGKLAKAREHYEEAVRLDPNYADPRYNLALVYERLGLHGKAFQQWRAYLKLDSRGPWAEYARSRLEAVPLRVLPSRKSLPDA
jgi:tetratricopeptide (TPR) repeat protein